MIHVCLAVLAVTAAAASISKSIEQGNRYYKQGAYDEALAAYQEAVEADPDAYIGQFNLGTALYRKGQYQEAIEAFTRVLNTEDRDLEGKALYNIANSRYRFGSRQAATDMNAAAANYRDALEYYKRAIELNPADRDARYNHELVQRQLRELLEKMKNQPPQQNKNQEQGKGEDKGQAEQDMPQQSRDTSGQQDRNDYGQEPAKEKGRDEDVAAKQAQAAEGQDKDKNKRDMQSRAADDKAEKMTPEEAQMLLDAYGQEEGRELMKNARHRDYRILKNW